MYRQAYPMRRNLRSDKFSSRGIYWKSQPAACLFGISMLLLTAIAPKTLGQTGQIYSITNLGALGMTDARGLNNGGEVVGGGANGHARLYSNGVMLDLGPNTSTAVAINNAGQVVGRFSSGGANARVFMYNGGALTDLGSPGPGIQPAAINNNGEVVGSFSGYGYGPAAVLYTGGGWTNILGPGFSYHSYAYSINSSRQTLIRVVHPTTGVEGRYLHSDGVLTGLGYATALNESGQVVGSSGGRAFLYSGGVTSDLGTLGGNNSTAYGINNNGQIVGVSTTSNGTTRAFIYSEGTMRDLGSASDLMITRLEWDTTPGALKFIYTNSITPVGGAASAWHPIAINDQGQILRSDGILLTPIEPSSTSAKLFWANGVGLANKISDTAIFTHTIPAGFTGGSAPVQVPASTLQNRPTNATHLLLVLNPENLMPESNTNNNSSALNITEPDLLASALAWNTGDGGLSFAYTVQTGTLARASTTAELFWANGTAISNKVSGSIFTHSIPANFGGQSSNITVSASIFNSPPTNATHVLLLVDSANLVAESSENNNVAVVPFPRPDLAPAYFRRSASGPDLEFSYTVQTGRTAIVATTAKFFWANGVAVSNLLSSTPIFTTNIPAGASGQSSNVTVSAANLQNLPTNATHVLLILDPDNLVVEGDEKNNVAALSLSCCGEELFTGQIPPTVSAHGWSASLSVSEDDGLVLNDLKLGTRYVAESISVPYFTILTAKMVQAGTNAQRSELRPNDPAGTPMRSHLVDFQPTNSFNPSNTNGNYSVQATYRIDEIPGSPGSSLCIFQRYEFLNKHASQPLEPSGKLDAQVVKPIVSYCFTGANGDSIIDINIPQRQAFWLDKRINNSTGVFRDVAIYEQPYYLGFVTSRGQNPLAEETSGVGFETLNFTQQAQLELFPQQTASYLGWWDNLHISFLDSIQEPIMDPEASGIPHAASEAIHIHWRWASHADLAAFAPGSKWVPTRGLPKKPTNSLQELKFAVVLLKANETDPTNYTTLIDTPPENLTVGRQVVWLEGIGHQNMDEFFGFGFGLEDHVHYLTNDVTQDAFFFIRDSDCSIFTGELLATLSVANGSRYALMPRPIYIVLNLPPGVILDSTPPATSPTGTTSGGDPYFRLDQLGRDQVLSPKSGNISLDSVSLSGVVSWNLSHGEETMDAVPIKFFIPSGVLNPAVLAQKTIELLNSYQVFAGTPPP